MVGRQPQQPSSPELLPQAEFVAYFDGTREPLNPGGNMGIAAVLYRGRERVWSFSDIREASPLNTNSVAQYLGLLAVIDRQIATGLAAASIEFRSDSKLVINQMFGSWGIHDGLYIDYARRA
jgi:ribonuclease HI